MVLLGLAEMSELTWDRVAQLVEHSPSKRMVLGSSPSVDPIFSESNNNQE